MFPTKSNLPHHEVEIKLSAPDVQAATTSLAACGFQVKTPRSFEANTVLDTSVQTLRQSGCLLRIRTFAGQVILTYKGPQELSKFKSRPEHEIALSDEAAAFTIFGGLGYTPVFRYEKYRTEFQDGTGNGVVTLDETPIGDFLELEGAEQWIEATASRLGYGEADWITASYGQLYQEYCGSRNLRPSHMTFGEISQ